MVRRDLVDEVKVMRLMPMQLESAQLESAAVQTEIVQLTEATTQTEAAMNLLALPPRLPGKCSVVPRGGSSPNPALKRSTSSPPDFGKEEHGLDGRWRMHDSVPGIASYLEEFEICGGTVIDGLSIRCRVKVAANFEGGRLSLQGDTAKACEIDERPARRAAAAAHAAADCSGSSSTCRPSRKPVDFCERSSRWRDAKGRYCRAPSPAALF